MNLQRLQNEICTCLWSTTLKNKLRECGHLFTEKELLGIAFHFAPTFEEQLRLMQLLADHGTTESEHAARCIAWQLESLEAFKRKNDHELYELRIKDDPDDLELRYLCESYDAALEMIHKFRIEYDFEPETELTRYVIQKRKIFRAGQPFTEDGLEELVFGAGKLLLTIEGPVDMTENGPCPHSCLNCEHSCVFDIEVCFPPFLTDRSPVRYRLSDGKIKYGIHLSLGCSDNTDACYIIPMDEEVIHYRSFDEEFLLRWHQHILCPNVEAVAFEDLDEPRQEFYRTFVAWLDGAANL